VYVWPKARCNFICNAITCTCKLLHSQTPALVLPMTNYSFPLSRLEPNCIYWHHSHSRRGPPHDPSHGSAVPHTHLHLLLWPRSSLGRSHVLGRQLSALGLVHVCEERLQAHLPAKCLRDRDLVGHAGCHLCCRRLGHGDGTLDTHHLRTMVCCLNCMVWLFFQVSYSFDKYC
jgi:hypothetical protein